jgi:hypothetical protein
MKNVVVINKRQLIITKDKAFFSEMIPFGISRICVRAFLLSNVTSAHRLNAIAALRAKTMQRITRRNDFQFISVLLNFTAKKKPITAKGIAKMVWLNFISER